MEKVFPSVARAGHIVTVYFVVLAFLIVVASTFYTVRFVRTLNSVKDNAIMVQGLSIANGAFVAITNLIYQFLAHRMTRWENWKFQVHVSKTF